MRQSPPEIRRLGTEGQAVGVPSAPNLVALSNGISALSVSAVTAVAAPQEHHTHGEHSTDDSRSKETGANRSPKRSFIDNVPP